MITHEKDALRDVCLSALAATLKLVSRSEGSTVFLISEGIAWRLGVGGVWRRRVGLSCGEQPRCSISRRLLHFLLYRVECYTPFCLAVSSSPGAHHHL